MSRTLAVDAGFRRPANSIIISEIMTSICNEYDAHHSSDNIPFITRISVEGSRRNLEIFINIEHLLP